MTIALDDLPHANDGPQGRSPLIDVKPTTRRNAIGYAVRGATFLGLVGLSVFRAPRRSGAENPPWTEFSTEGCAVYPVDPEVCSDNMCVGTTLELMDNSFCTINCGDVDANNWHQWHKNKRYGHYQYRDYPGDICRGAPPNLPRDAWWWSVGQCGTCNPAIYRCHDGQKRATATQEWDFTICEGLAQCNGTAPTC